MCYLTVIEIDQRHCLTLRSLSSDLDIGCIVRVELDDGHIAGLLLWRLDGDVCDVLLTAVVEMCCSATGGTLSNWATP